MGRSRSIGYGEGSITKRVRMVVGVGSCALGSSAVGCRPGRAAR
jgi:hypothetical protein